VTSPRATLQRTARLEASEHPPADPAAPKVLSIDIGGSHVKMLVNGLSERRRFVSGPAMTPEEMVEGVLDLTKPWEYDSVSVGVPAPVLANRVIHEPINLGPGWVGFDFETAFGEPTKVVNDAAMQALGSYDGGRMLFLGLGTGLGSTMILDGIIEGMELGHLPYRKATYEDYVGEAGRKRLGRKKWTKLVLDVIERFSAALEPDYVVLGGGNAARLADLPGNARRGRNEDAFLGGFRLWAPGSGVGRPSAYAESRSGRSPVRGGAERKVPPWSR
jgi:predicted NBD/HSP70 family sugar kinase